MSKDDFCSIELRSHGFTWENESQQENSSFIVYSKEIAINIKKVLLKTLYGKHILCLNERRAMKQSKGGKPKTANL